MRTTIIILTFFTTIGIILYWFFIFVGIFPVIEIIPGYKNWFMSFPLADFWIAFSSFLAGIFLLMKKEISVPFGISAGSTLIFLGLNAFLFGYNTGLLFILTLDEMIEIAIKIYCLSIGPLFILYFWRIRKTFN